MHEAEVEAEKREAVEDASVDEGVALERGAQHDCDDEERMHEPVELVPDTAQVTRHFVGERVRIF